ETEQPSAEAPRAATTHREERLANHVHCGRADECSKCTRQHELHQVCGPALALSCREPEDAHGCNRPEGALHHREPYLAWLKSEARATRVEEPIHQRYGSEEPPERRNAQYLRAAEARGLHENIRGEAGLGRGAGIGAHAGSIGTESGTDQSTGVFGRRRPSPFIPSLVPFATPVCNPHPQP